MLKVLTVFGTRPEAIKMAPVVKRLQAEPKITSCVCVTAQHRQMLDEVLDVFDIHPDYDLDIMRPNQSLSYLTSEILLAMENVIQVERPDWMLVQGDTTTVMAASLTAFYQGVLVGHVEAGLRTWNKRQPFPEEINRRIADVLADLYFAPTTTAQVNLLKENVPQENIRVTGNTIVDALQHVLSQVKSSTAPATLPMPENKRLILVTAHRRESFGEPLQHICRALVKIAAMWGATVQIFYPVHPNPNVRSQVYRLLANIPGITLTEPLDYLSFIHVMSKAHLIITDSGGIQEEATVLGKPVLITREVTERVEAVAAGTARLVGTSERSILLAVDQILHDTEIYLRMSQSNQVYGDGNASNRIVDALLNHPLTTQNSRSK